MRGLDDITGAVIDAAVNLHRDLGPGLLESVMRSCSPACSNAAASTLNAKNPSVLSMTA